MAEREKNGFSPALPATNYEENPHELPQAFNSDPREGLQAFNVGQLILVDDKGSDAPEHAEFSHDPMFVVSDSDRSGADRPGTKDTTKGRRRRMCGLPPRMFWLLLAVLLLLIIGAAVGGGVGGSIVAHNRRKAQAASESLAAALAIAPASAASSSAASSSSPAAATTTTSVATAPSPASAAPSSTSTPGYGDFTVEVFEGQNFTGSHRNYSSVGIFPLPWAASSYIWDGRQSGCCVTFCSESIWVGFRCQSDTHQPKTSVDMVVLGCGGPAAESNSTCQ
ncbi:hypothetical protein AOQ84DRAFT_362981 [Glonium stellatum]|uniref:Uncharacterized protein n=1 Tax=Glonium stellatum TaxID=574774 RepID=A0A8E2F3B0_9PEZI|nr:hypothetical protein AOQ84DRAFT_362981 [Glonium stellatum]